MGNLIVKDNALIEASHRLGEVEQRLVLLAVLKARSVGDTVEKLKDKTLTIHADDYITNFGGTRQGAYKALKQAVMGLFDAKWGYKYLTNKGEQRVRYERFTQSADYGEGEGTVKFMFSTAIIPMLIELEKRFTSYEIEQVSQLSSGYAMRLYEFCIQHLDKKTGKGWLEISLNDLRFRFGLLPTEYAKMGNFKARVLDYSIDELNKKTDISIYYKQKKQGRTIVGFRFEFKKKIKKAPRTKSKEQQATRTIDIFNGFTDLERQAIQERIEEHIQRLEQQGEIVGDWHKDNITQKAVTERWGLDVLAKKQEKEQKRKERLAKKQAEQQAKEEQECQAKERAEQRRATLIATFESLTAEQQDLILDEIYNKIKSVGVFSKIFKEYRQKNTVHTNPLFAGHFYELLGL